MEFLGSFPGETSGGVAKCWLSSQANLVLQKYTTIRSKNQYIVFFRLLRCVFSVPSITDYHLNVRIKKKGKQHESELVGNWMKSQNPSSSLNTRIPRFIINCGISFLGRKDGALVRALVSHQSGPGSTPGVDAICGLSLLLVLSLATRRFYPGTSVFPSPQKPTIPNSNSIWNTQLQRVLKNS